MSRTDCLLGSSEGRTSRDAAVGASERLPVECRHVQGSGGRRAPRDSTVGAHERLPVGPAHSRCCERARTRVGVGERRALIVRRTPPAIWKTPTRRERTKKTPTIHDSIHIVYTTHPPSDPSVPGIREHPRPRKPRRERSVFLAQLRLRLRLFAFPSFRDFLSSCSCVRIK